MTYTEDEIETAARNVQAYFNDRFESSMSLECAVAIAREAFSAVSRVPDGFWMAPDVADARMIDASIRAVVPGENGNMQKCSRKEKHRRRYRAMRDVVKGRKP